MKNISKLKDNILKKTIKHQIYKHSDWRLNEIQQHNEKGSKGSKFDVEDQTNYKIRRIVCMLKHFVGI